MIQATDSIRDWLADQRLRGLSPQTIDRRRRCLAQLETHCSTCPSEVTKGQFRDWLSAQSQGGASFSLRMTRPFYRWLITEELRSDDPTQGITVTAPDEPQTTATDEQVESMLKHSKRSLRDHAIVALLVATGARRGEIGNLTLADLSDYLDSGMIRISRSKTCARVVPIDVTAERAVRRYLRSVNGQRIGRGMPPGATHNAWRVSDGPHLVGRAVERHSDGLSPHAIRRWFVTRVASRGMSPASIGRQLGWSAGTTNVMLVTYTKATAGELLVDEYRRVIG